MSEHEKTRADSTAEQKSTPRFVTHKFIQRRGVRGFNIMPMPASGPPPTPDPPDPKWRVPVEYKA